ncbi:GNAT family N-acetyltransferase, partial [Candidatus Thorarchaeota archaeon]
AIYKSLLIDIVWIEEAHRGRGYGRALVSEAERIAQSNGCISAQTSSYSFQAPEFYQALGYEVFGEFDGYPDGIKKYYLGKTL